MRVYLRCCGSASSMQWVRHYLRWNSCRRRFRCCSPLNSGQSGGKRGHAYLAGSPKLQPPLHSAAGRRRRRNGGLPSPPMMRRQGTAGPGSSEGRGNTERGRCYGFLNRTNASLRNGSQPAWWSVGEPCWLLDWPGGGAGGKTLWREPAFAAETTPSLLSSTKRTRSYCEKLARLPAEKYAALFPALAAELWRTRLSADWYARLSKPFSDWMTCSVRRGKPRLLSCPASSGRWSRFCTGCRWGALW